LKVILPKPFCRIVGLLSHFGPDLDPGLSHPQNVIRNPAL
jgi:hypothetical protein